MNSSITVASFFKSIPACLGSSLSSGILRFMASSTANTNSIKDKESKPNSVRSVSGLIAALSTWNFVTKISVIVSYVVPLKAGEELSFIKPRKSVSIL